MSGISLIILIQKNKINDKIKKFTLSIAFAGITFSALVIIDSAVGLISKDESTQVQKPKGLIFPPNSKARYQTVEFDYVAEINSLGLRDSEIQIEKGEKFRILCFGDSYTFGWGVNVENSWPKVLERILLDNGFESIEVINCGKGGEYTVAYKKHMAKVVPLLKPDLVLVGILQVDDLVQLYKHKYLYNQDDTNTKNISNSFTRNTKSVVGKYLKHSFNNILSLQSIRKHKTINIKPNWATASASVIEKFTLLGKIRFSILDETVQKLFKSGDLNPHLINSYIGYSDMLTIFNNQNHPATQYSIQQMDKHFKDMKNICDKYNSNLIFVNLPANQFTGHIVIRTPGDVLNSYYQANNNVDPMYRSIANANNLGYIELTEHFIGLKNKSGYYFKYDGHPNEKGYEEIAKFIGKQLIEQDKLKKDSK